MGGDFSCAKLSYYILNDGRVYDFQDNLILHFEKGTPKDIHLQKDGSIVIETKDQGNYLYKNGRVYNISSFVKEPSENLRVGIPREYRLFPDRNVLMNEVVKGPYAMVTFGLCYPELHGDKHHTVTCILYGGQLVKTYHFPSGMCSFC